VAESAPGSVQAAWLFGPALLDERPGVGRRHRTGAAAYRLLAIVTEANGVRSITRGTGRPPGST